MALRIAIGIAALIALGLCFLSMRDVPHNTMIKDPHATMTILWVLLALITVACALALIRGSRKTAVASFVASGLGILFSLMLACV
jgi:drug/metabolite transporter (DMT)-like permease